jgi:hypothetical protein
VNPNKIVSNFTTTYVIKNNLWHDCLRHPFSSVIRCIKNIFLYIDCDLDYICDACHFSKQAKLPFQKDSHRSATAFDLLHMDIWGPLNSNCIHGHHYFLTIVDDFSRHTCVH